MKKLAWTFVGWFVFLGASSSVSFGADAASLSPLRRPPLKIIKGTVSSDAKYLEFVRWHEQHSVLSVILSSDNREAVKKTLDTLATLKRRNVLIGEIVVIGSNNFDLFTSLDKMPTVSRREFDRLMKKNLVAGPARKRVSYEDFLVLLQAHKKMAASASALGLGAPTVVPTQSLFNTLPVNYSPAWVVRYQGRNFVYEGNVDPKRLFSMDGKFLGANETF